MLQSQLYVVTDVHVHVARESDQETSENRTRGECYHHRSGQSCKDGGSRPIGGDIRHIGVDSSGNGRHASQETFDHGPEKQRAITARSQIRECRYQDEEDFTVRLSA